MVAEHELFEACKVLFGTKIRLSSGFLEYLQLSGIKSAYRQKALETHPDRVANDTNISVYTDHFVSVQLAYERLCNYVKTRTKGYLPVANQATSKPNHYRTYSQEQYNKSYCHPSTSGTNKYSVPLNSNIYNGPMPDRRLLFGHYLYYSGIASWLTISKALIWQRTKRPRIGELGCQLGWLSSKDILNILNNRSTSNTFGKSAIHMGLLNKTQLKMLILQQKKLQKKFGEYFIANNLLSSVQLDQLVKQLWNHNYTISGHQTSHRTM